MTSRKAFPVLPLLFFIAFVSCSPPEPLLFEPGTFEPSGMEKADFVDRFARDRDQLRSLSGRANVQVSEPGNTERLSVIFSSDRKHSLLRLRNNLGIEGGRIYSDPDSVIIYNRFEEQAHKMSHEDAAWFYLNGITAMNLLQILHPVTSPEIISAIYENDDYFLVETVNGDRHYVERDHYRLKRTERRVLHPEAYSTFHFENYTEIEGLQVPGRIQILSSDENSNIFFVIRSLEINPPALQFDPEIPDDMEIYRL